MTSSFRILVKYFGECVRTVVLNRSVRSLLTPIFSVLGLILFCEFTIYYLTLLNCTWPKLDGLHKDPYIPVKSAQMSFRIMVLAGTALKENDTSRWFGPDRVFWQMQRSFRAASFIHNPDVVIIVGNLFNVPAARLSPSELKTKMTHFSNLFVKQSSAEYFFTLPGAEDLGNSPREMSASWLKLQSVLPLPPVQLHQLPGFNAILMNSALYASGEDSSCSSCRQSVSSFTRIAQYLSCSRGDQLENLPDCVDEDPNKFVPQPVRPNTQPNKRKLINSNVGGYSRPLLIQNLPLSTNGLSSVCSRAHVHSKLVKSNLSQDQSDYIIRHLHPRLILSTGPANDRDCFYHVKLNDREFLPTWILPRFGWTDDLNVDVGFLLIRLNANDYSVSKCYLPREKTIYNIYSVGLFLIILWFLWPQLMAIMKILRITQTRVQHTSEAE